MRKAAALFLALCLLLLSACGGGPPASSSLPGETAAPPESREEPPAQGPEAPGEKNLGHSLLPEFQGQTSEDFLGERTPEELLQYMDAAYSAIGGRPFLERDGFDSPAELSSDDLLSFFFRTMESWDFFLPRGDEALPPEDDRIPENFRIPLEAVTNQLDRCFGEGSYTLEMEESAYGEWYDPATDSFTAPVFIGFGDTISRELVGAEAEGDIVTITAHTMTLDPPIVPTTVETLRLEVRDGNVRFLSFENVPV